MIPPKAIPNFMSEFYKCFIMSRGHKEKGN